MRIATSRYRARELIVASGLAPVRTTVGNPRFALGYELAGACGMIAPYGLLKVTDREEFTRRYRERLERSGWRKIGNALTAIAREQGAPGVVLLCFEDVTKPGEWCHRRIFAEWWQEQTGQVVLELEGQ